MKNIRVCPICESKKTLLAYLGRTLRLKHDRSVWAVQRCKDCGHGFVDPQPEWHELENYYQANYDPYDSQHGIESFNNALTVARNTGKLRHVKIDSRTRLLDVGSGGGVFLRLARELGAECYGVEPSIHGFAASKAFGLNVFNGDLSSYIVIDPSPRFGLITANHVVEHHPDPVKMLREMKSILMPGGTLWIAVPNGACLSARRLEWKWHSTDLPYHLHHFCRESLLIAVERAGLSVKNIKTESLENSVYHSILAELRSRWKLPIRLSRHLPLSGLARRRAFMMDKTLSGEAILAELE